ncbi:helix-turn-helix protein [Bacillus oleivorans]|uniref:Helix-turn-helix protein n=1 Tax=Bacillus oleivorans TaxID=1448271 RepID=A0A285CM80_9BACI|nr:metalloregulator ArsR/SmtB family transcription factor [Bacillus oleivorans]SNX68515.1 helix-turn-helix protein [Bacillus oleivorans]
MTDIYRALSDSIRRQILQMLSRREYTQSEIVECFTISQPAIKKHLNILEEEQLILVRKEGKYRYYRLNKESFEKSYSMLQKELELILDYKLMKLKNYLEEENE